MSQGSAYRIGKRRNNSLANYDTTNDTAFYNNAMDLGLRNNKNNFATVDKSDFIGKR